MALKIFTYKGKTIDELKKLSINEFAALVPSRLRRSIKRGFSDEKKHVLNKLEKKGKAKTQRRDMVIVPQMVGKTILVHNGKTYQSLLITDEMVGHFLGEFAMTRAIVKHSSPGIGATKSTSSVSVK